MNERIVVNVIRQFLILQRFQPLIQNIFMSLACGAAHRPLDAVVPRLVSRQLQNNARLHPWRPGVPTSWELMRAQLSR